jgi:metal-responsive CopG/Arc/MetJ family transcriptional regulator
MSNKKRSKNEQIIPLRVPGDMAKKIDEAVQKRGENRAVVMRDAIRLGLDRFDQVLKPQAA